MENIKHLLGLVGKISEKNNEILDATGGRFNMFRVCGVNHYENTHSAIIAEFLNPKGSHGLKSKLLECFIETLGNDFKIQNFDCESAQIITEYSTDQGRIDLFIKDNQNKAIIIENKIYAGDQWKQLKRYDIYANDKYKKGNYQILYLTLNGVEASKQSRKGVDYYLPISYAENIIMWLEKCVAIASRFPMVRETVIQYINHLKQLTNQDMSAKNEQEVVNILLKSENFMAGLDISNNMNATKRKALKLFAERLSQKSKIDVEVPDKSNYLKFLYSDDFFIYFGEDKGCIYSSIKTKDSLNGKAKFVEKASIFTLDKGQPWNPYGYSFFSNRQFWTKDDGSTYAEMLKEDSELELFFLNEIEKIKNWLDENVNR